MSGVFKKCSSCKADIALGADYYVCSVSTCNSKRMGLFFCTMNCFERHLPGARHRDAGAIEKRAPRTIEVEAQEEAPRRRIIVSNKASSASTTVQSSADEVLVVVSKLKNYIKARSDMNTGGSVMEVLSDRVRRLCDGAIDQARADGRKTVLDRDFK